MQRARDAERAADMERQEKDDLASKLQRALTEARAEGETGEEAQVTFILRHC